MCSVVAIKLYKDHEIRKRDVTPRMSMNRNYVFIMSHVKKCGSFFEESTDRLREIKCGVCGGTQKMNTAPTKPLSRSGRVLA